MEKAAGLRPALRSLTGLDPAAGGGLAGRHAEASELAFGQPRIKGKEILMRAFDMSHGYPTVVVEDVDGWVCGECVCRGVTGLCFLHGVAGAPQVEDTQSACSGLMARLDRYNEKCGTTWTVVNEYPLELAEALFAL